MGNAKQIISALVLTWVLCLAPVLAAPQGFQREERSMTVDGRQRDYIVLIPRGLAPGQRLPLVFGLHGGFGKGESFEQSALLHEAKGAQDFIFVYPSGYHRSWNAGNCCGQAANRKVDDIKFFRELIVQLVKREQVDAQRVFFTGFSNGAMMTYRVACEMAGEVAAVAPVSAGLAMPLTECHPARELPLLHIHGSLDLWAPFNGGEGVRQEAGVQHNIPGMLSSWQGMSGCNEMRSVSLLPGAECIQYSACSRGVELDLCVVAGLGHQWPGDQPADRVIRLFGPPAPEVRASDAILAFFRKYL